MIDPYGVLGLSRNASDEEIKKAYRTLSRKYHPDANINNPNKAAAEERFKEVQAAYNQIMDERQNGSSSYGYNYNSYSNNSYSSSTGDSDKLRAAANYLNARHYSEALNVLFSIPENERAGKWYFFASIASQGLGNLNNARDYIQMAIALEPYNIQYRQFAQQLEFGSSWYTSASSSYGYSRPYSGASRWCLSMLLLNLFCNICCFGCRI